MAGAVGRARKLVAGATAAVLAFGAVLFAPTAAQAAPGDASATSVAINLNAGVNIIGLNLPLVALNGTVGTAVAPAGGGTSQSGLLGVNIANGVLQPGGATGQVVNTTATRTAAGSSATSEIANVNVGLLGINAVTTGAVTANATCPAGGQPTASANVVGLQVLGQAVTLNANSVTVPAVNVNVAGLVGVQIGGLVRQVISTTSTTAASAAVVVDLRLTATALGLPIDLNLGSVTLAQASCQSPNATVTAMNPTSGPTAGGTSVTITGNGLQNATGVTFGASPAASYTVAPDGTSITAVAPASETAGAVAVTVARPTGNVSAGNFTYVAPTITSVAPPQGTTAGGTSVTITGTGLNAATSVTFGGTAGTITARTATTLTVTTPAHVAGAVPVAVVLPGLDVTAANAYTYVVPTNPTVATMTPTTGPAAGSTAVTITGTNLGNVSTVTFGGTAGTITAQNATSLTVTTPAHAPGPVAVVLTNPGGQTTAASPFTYTDDGSTATLGTATPASVPTSGGTRVTIPGTGLAGVTGVTVRGVAATDVVATGTSVAFTVPASETAGAAPLVVQFPAGTRPAGSLTYVAPTVTGVTPATGPAAGGQTVTVTGTGLNAQTAVTLGGTPATVTAAAPDGTSLTVTTPAHAPGQVGVVVTLPGADASLAAAYTYLADGTGVTVTGIDPATSPTRGGGTVTVSGSGFTGATGLRIGTQTVAATVGAGGTTISATVPPSETAGSVPVAVLFPAGEAAAGSLVYVAPTTALDPTQGPTTGGTTVTITGTGLTGATGVSFGGTAGTGVTVVSDTLLRVTTPAHAAGPVNVVVTLPGLDATVTNGFAFLTPGVATVSAVTPDSGPVAGGTTVTLTGTGLGTVSAVTFGGVPAAITPGGTATSLTVTTPPHAAGPVPIVLTNAGGTSTLPAGFTYLGDGTGVTVGTLTPGTVPTAGGTTVTLTGTGLTGASGVTVGGAAASNVVVAPGGTSLTFTVPPSEVAGGAPVVVQFPLGTTPAGTLTYQGPALTTVAPAQGPTSGGTTVTLTGTGLEAATGVTFGGIPATGLTVVGPGQISVTAPAQGAGAVPVQVTLPGLDPAAGTYTYLADGAGATVTSTTPAQLPTSGGTVTVSGTGLAAATGMTVGGIPVTGFSAAGGTVTGTVPPSETAGPRPVVLLFPAGTVPAGSVTLVAPTLTAVSPAFGVSFGGNRVTLTGTNLAAATGVTFGGVAATDLTIAPDGTSIVVTAPAGAPAVVDVAVQLPGADAALTGAYTYLDDGTEAVIAGVAPTEVPTTGGTTVTITGTGLATVTGVTIGGLPASNVVAAPDGTSVTATTPPSDIASAATVTLAFQAGTVVAGTIQYVGPTITAVTPAEGPQTGGTSVTLTGTGLTGASQVTFGGVPGTITAVAPGGTGITVTAPAHAPGPVDVVVALTGVDAVAPAAFTYLADGTGATVTGIAPSTVPTGGGTVVVSGTGLGPVTGATVGGQPATVVVAPGGTGVTVTAPATETAGPADVVLQFPGGTLAAGPITYAAPTVASLDPASGVAAGGNTVTLLGTGLAGATAVTFGGVPATDVVPAADGLSVTVTVPPGLPGPVDIAVELPGLDAALAGGYTYLDDGTNAVVTGLTPTTSPTSGGGTITITGTGLAGATGVRVGTNAASAVVASPDGTTVTAVVPPSETVGTQPVVLVFPEGEVPVGDLTYVAPTITGIAPAVGGTGGGTAVTITGTGLGGATGVLFGGLPGIGVTPAADGLSLVVWTPAQAEGTVDITVQLPGLDVGEADAFTYEADGTGAVVTGMTPTTSPTAGGGTLTITGSGFTGATTVEIGGVVVPLDSQSDTELTLTIPPSDVVGDRPVVIVYTDGTALAGTLTYVASTVTDVAPPTGGVAGGTEVTLTGTDLGAVTAVLVDGESVTPTAVSATSVTFVAPPHAAGPVTLVLEQPGADVTLADAFTYVPDGTGAVVTGMTPTEVLLAGGETVTITGTDLGGATGVEVDGVPATDVVVAPDGTSITFTVPPGTAPGVVGVEIQYPTGGVDAGELEYIADGSDATLTSATPLTGVTSGGTVVTLTGAGFTGATGVTFGGVAGTGFTVVSDTEIQVTTPAADAAGAVPVVVQFPGGDVGGLDFTYVVATVTSILPTEGREAGGQPVTLTGTDLQNVTDVVVGGVSVPVTSASATTVTFTAPAHAPGVVDLVLVQPGADLTLPGAFTYLRDGTGAVVTGLDPVEVLLGGGTTVTISGTGLGGATGVTVGGVAATDVVSAPDGTTITFTVPPGTAPGPVPVTIGYPAGPGVDAGELTYVDDGTATTVDDVTPTSSPSAGGGTLTLTGSGLAGVIGVTVGGVPATDLVATGGTVTVTIPPSDVPGPAAIVLQFPAGTVDAGTLVYRASTVTGLTPAEGPQAGGTTVTVTGTDLGAVTEVLVDGVSVAPSPGPGGTSLSFTTPAHAPGVVDVVLVQPGVDVPLPGAFTYLLDGSAAVVSGIDPSTVPLAGGTTVTIGGTGLTGATGVTVGGQEAEDVVVAPDGTSITFTAPPGTAVGTDPVTIQYPGGTVPAGDLTYADDGTESTVTDLDPAQSPTAGGVTVTVTGTGLTNATGVTFGGVAGTGFTVVSDTEITVVVPAADAAGDVPVVVVFPAGELPAGTLTYVAAVVTDVDPAQGPQAGGTTVTLTGTDLEGVTQVIVGGTAAPVITATGTTVSFSTPPHAPGAVDLVLVRPGADLTLPGAFTYLADGTGAVVSGIDPSTVPLAGGPTVTIGGTGLTGATGVTVGGEDVGPIVVAPDGTSITFPAPAGTTAGDQPVVITYPAGPGVPAGDLTYADDGSQSEVTDLDPETSPTSGGITLTLTGTGLTGATGVTVGGVTATDFVVVSDTEITVTVPAGAPGAAAVVVEFPAGELDAGSITYLADGTDAVVDGLDPTTAPLAGGTTITITGTGLAGATGVTVGGVPADDVVVAPDGTSITFTAPPGTATGPAAVEIQYPAGAPVPAGDLDYLDDGSQTDVDGIDPTQVGTAGGVVTITGSGFTNVQDVLVRGASAPSFTVVSDTEIQVTLPATETPGAAPVGLVLETGPAVPAGTVTYVASTVTAVDPAQVAQTGGQTITVTGTRLGAVTAVLVDGVSVPATPDGAGTALTFVAPAHAPGAVSLVLVQPGADVPVTDGLTYLADGSDAVVTGLSPDTAPLAGGTRVTITGTGLVGASGVTVDGVAATAVVVAPDGTSIAFTVPAGTEPGVVDVEIQYPAGSGVGAGELEYLDDGSGSSVTSWSPATAPTSGDWPFTITGTGFSEATGVRVRGLPVLRFAVAPDGTSITGMLPPSETGGPADVWLDFPAGEMWVGSLVYAAPVVTTLSPAQGPVAGGTTVTITGSGLEDATQVLFGGVAGTGLTVVPGGLTVVAPAHAAGLVDVQVVIPGADAWRVGGFGYVPPDGPFLSGLTPASGPTAGGTTVTITGTGLGTTTAVTFGGVPATIVGTPTATQVVVTVPAHGAGPVAVAVTNEAGTGTLPGGYTYVAPVTGPTMQVTYYTPRFGPTSGGQTIAIGGSGFVQGRTSVTFGGVAAQSVTVLSDTALVVVTPPHPEGVVPMVVAVDGVDAQTLGYEYDAVAAPLPSAPTVGGVNPSELPAAGGVPVTVVGTGFVSGDTSVVVCGVLVDPGEVTVAADGTSLTFTAPACGPGTTDLVVITPGGTVSAPVTYFASSVLAAPNDPAGSGSGTGPLAVTGSDIAHQAPWWAAALVVWGLGLLLVSRVGVRYRRRLATVRGRRGPRA